MSEREVFLIRHGHDDHSYIDGNNNTSLTLKGIEGARQMGTKMAALLGDSDIGVVDIHTSSRKRSVETAEILSEELDKSQIAHGFHVDERLKELYQGKIINVDILTHQEKAALLQLAWEIFDEDRVEGGMDYHFGDFQSGEEAHYPLRGFIEDPYGESQGEFSYRIGSALHDILQDVVDKHGTPIVVAHRGGIREIRNILHATNNNLPVKQSSECEMSGLIYCEIVSNPIRDVDFSLRALDNYLKTLKGDAGRGMSYVA